MERTVPTCGLEDDVGRGAARHKRERADDQGDPDGRMSAVDGWLLPPKHDHDTDADDHAH